ncbi:MAG: phenylacetate--CoA ligase family protein [Chloroflexi bacterium]|nr:phenylacetate--CoA ligase family protein [Chloroflexota bacterium]
MNAWFANKLYLGLQALRGEPVATALADVYRTEFMPLEQLRAVQAERMKEQIRFAVRNVPYYQEMYVPYAEQIEKLEGWEDVQALMERLPAVEKEDVLQRPERLTARNVGKLRTHPDKTSGSTGTPIVFPCDQKAWAYRHALTIRTMKMHGVENGEPYALLFGLHWNKLARTQVKLRDWVFNRVRVSAFDLGKDTFEEYYQKVKAHKPTHFMGYPSSTYDFCFLAHERGIDLRELRLKALFLTSEPLFEHQRQLMEEVTGTHCVNIYGSAEGGLSAFECPSGNLHVTAEATWMRKRGLTGSGAEFLVTDMMLRAFPMINYGIGDEGEFKEGRCDCGRSHPMIKVLSGRSGEPIVLPNGRRINANLPSYIFKPFARLRVIRRFRFVLQGRDLRLYLVVSDGFGGEHMGAVEREVRAAFGEDILFSTHIVPALTPLPNAKHRTFIVLPVLDT